MNRQIGYSSVFIGLIVVLMAGCESPYHQDHDALFGGLLGAGAGAVIGHAAGNTAAGAVIGAGVGALTGAAIGAEKDQEEARNRALIEQQMHRQIEAGAASIQEVVAMTHAGIAEPSIINYVQTRGMILFLQPPDLIYLKQQGVSDNVVQAMQTAPRVQPPVVVEQPGPPVVIEGGPYWHRRPYYYY